MQRQRVKSSNIYSLGIEEGVVEAEFGSGAIWKYWPISQATFDRVLNAPSIGKAFNQEIRDVAENSKQVS